jgi:hypothetical protein
MDGLGGKKGRDDLNNYDVDVSTFIVRLKLRKDFGARPRRDKSGEWEFIISLRPDKKNGGEEIPLRFQIDHITDALLFF